MSNDGKNPKAAIEAIFPCNIEICPGVEVYPLTLGHYALLEKMNSYVVNDDHKPDSIETIETFYVCTHSAKETFKVFDNLGEVALDWAETLHPSVVNRLSEAILTQIRKMADVTPVVSDKKKIKVETASSQL